MKKIVVLALTLCLAFAGSALAADTVRIGLMGPMTGPWASEGQEMKQVLDLLAEELNAAGGIAGKTKVEIVSEDDGGDPRTASLAAQRLASRDIAAVIGTYGSSITEATQNIYDEESIVQVANGSTAIRLSEKGLKYFFRTCPRDDEQGRVAAETLKNLGFGKIAILHDNTSYARGLADETRALLEAAEGVEIVLFEALTPGEQDYNTILTRLRGTGPDAVFFTGYYPEAGLLLRQKAEMGWDVPFMGGDATNHPDLVKIAGAASAEGFRFVSAPLPKDLDNAEAKDFVDAFQKKYGNPPSSIYAVLAGDGFRVVAEAIGKTGSTDPDAMAAFLKTELGDFPGLTGQISFDEKGDRVGEVYRAYRVDEKGEFILQP